MLDTLTSKIQRGFTLVELLITMTVLGIITAVALPNLSAFVVGNRLSSNVNGFVGLINFARSEAIARNQSVLVCAKSNVNDSCVDSESWAEFVTQVFVDVDGSNSWTAGDVLLKRTPALDVSTTQTTFNRASPAATPRYIKYGANGMSESPLHFRLYAVGDAAYNEKYGRSICISKPGRVRVTPLTLANACNSF